MGLCPLSIISRLGTYCYIVIIYNKGMSEIPDRAANTQGYASVEI